MVNDTILFACLVIHIMWLGGIVVRESDLQLRHCVLGSHTFHRQVTDESGQVVHAHVLLMTSSIILVLKNC